MRIEHRPLETLTPYAGNARRHPPEQIDEIAVSLTQFGMVGEIVVRNGVVAKGHGTLEAIRAIYAEGGLLYPAPGKFQGAEPFPPGTVPVRDVSGWTEEQFRQYVLADNKTAEKSSWDADLLRQELEELEDMGADLEVTGFGEEWRDLLDDLDDGDRRAPVIEEGGGEDEAPPPPAAPKPAAAPKEDPAKPAGLPVPLLVNDCPRPVYKAFMDAKKKLGVKQNHEALEKLLGLFHGLTEETP